MNSQSISIQFSILFALIFLFHGEPAFAHLMPGQSVNFISGLQHPWSGIDHSLLLVCVGFWGAWQGRSAIWMLPVFYVAAMGLGLVMALLKISFLTTAFSAALGVAVVMSMWLEKKRVQYVVSVACTCLLAIFQGHVHGSELAAGISGILFCLGLLVSTIVLQSIGMLVCLLFCKAKYTQAI